MTKYQNSKNYLCRKIVDDIILFPIDEKTAGFRGGIYLNNVSYFVWTLLENPKTVEEISYEVSNEFKSDMKIVKPDIEELMEQFIDMKVVNILH